MRAFEYIRADDPAMAVRAASRPDAQFLAGGTTLLDLMKLDVMRPKEVIDVTPLASKFSRIESDEQGLHLGAFVRMAEAADHADVLRDYPMIAQSLQLAASAQIRNMATLGGNVLQRTRCNYFRDGWPACNKRVPGSGCAAIGGVNRKHAVLGTSDNCIATYPGDFAQALIALDAEVEIVGSDGARRMRFEDLHRAPGSTPHVETALRSGDLITGFFVPAGAWAKHSLYLKVRDRESYEFALASAAVALDMRGDMVTQARIALGGVATKPWRAREAEAVLNGKRLDERTARAVAEIAFVGAVTHGGNDFKPELGRRTLVRALMTLAEG
jgi:xanthine dehydrogenase YagS FAD-binding subunit